ncbi:MAG: Gfo/Idh/MocA family oxidoreductase [Bacteroidota bacterium]
MKAKKKNDNSRRKFIKKTGSAALGFMIVPRYCVAGSGMLAPSDRVNLAFVGVGGKGVSALKELSSQNIVALCDVDQKRAKEGFKLQNKARKFVDYRQMFDEMGSEIDGVVISTPDHTHAVIGLAAMELDKHVYLEKPMAHNIAEVRALTEAAKAKPNLITQMGNQGASGDGIRKFQEIYDSGMIGEVEKVYVWTNRPIWPQGNPIPTQKQKVPNHLNWDLWQGPAQYRDYNEAFLPFSWRGFWDYGTGALGDMGCHLVDGPFYTLDLGYPTWAEASVSQVYSQNWDSDYTPESCPPASKVHLMFPEREGRGPVELVWMDGGIMPLRPEELASDEPMGDWGGGVLMIGSQGKLMSDVYCKNPRLLPLSRNEEDDMPEPTLARVETTHTMDWVNGIVNGYQPSSHFAKAGPLTEAILMGNLAIRSYNHRIPTPDDPNSRYKLPGRTKLFWDAENMRVTNVDIANQFVSREYRTGW